MEIIRIFKFLIIFLELFSFKYFIILFRTKNYNSLKIINNIKHYLFNKILKKTKKNLTYVDFLYIKGQTRLGNFFIIINNAIIFCELLGCKKIIIKKKMILLLIIKFIIKNIILV